MRARGSLFCDIERETLGLDPAHLARCSTTRSGPSCPCTTPASAATWPVSRPRSAVATSTIIEDNAHGLFGSYRGRPLGSLGRFATLSFHETKNFICGEGGALIVNDEQLRRPRAHVLYDKGTNRRAFMLGRGRQVLVAGHRFVVRAERRARRDSSTANSSSVT